MCISLIKACNPFSYRTNPEGMLFLWQCQVVSLHYSWACAPAPVQGLSSSSNAIFIIHKHKARQGWRCARGIDGNAITPNKQTLNHTLIPLQLLLDYDFSAGESQWTDTAQTHKTTNTQTPKNMYTENYCSLKSQLECRNYGSLGT